MTHALLVTRDDALLDDVLRLAAAAGVRLEVAPDAGAALRAWNAGDGVVLVGADQATATAAHRPPSHDRLYVVARGEAGDALFRDALVLGARAVVEVPAAEAWLVEVLSDVVDGARAPARTIGVVAGSGGAGASTFAGALAQAAARADDTLLIDLDPWGAGADRVVGLDEADGIRWDALLTASGRLGSRSLRAALPHRDRLAVLSWAGSAVADVEPAAVREVLGAAQRGSAVVVVDLPRALAGAAHEVAGRCDEVLLVVRATVQGVAAASRVAGRLAGTSARLGVVVPIAGPALPSDQVGAALGLPVLAEYPVRRRVAEQVDLGVGPLGARRSPLARAVRGVLEGGEAVAGSVAPWPAAGRPA